MYKVAMPPLGRIFGLSRVENGRRHLSADTRQVRVKLSARHDAAEYAYVRQGLT